MAKKSTGTGQGGKTYEERELAKTVRNLALTEIERILRNRKDKLYGPVLVKVAGTVLPRLNQHSGEDGGPIQIQGVEIKVRKA
jgi:hypothetical protein